MSEQLTRKRVFTSFQYEDVRYARLMDAWSANENNDFEMYGERLRVAVDSKNADYIKAKLRPKIERSSVLVCLIGCGTSRSGWVRWEINHAIKNNKGLVGVLLKPSNSKLPAIVDQGAVFVPFEKNDIGRAVEWASRRTATKGDYSY